MSFSLPKIKLPSWLTKKSIIVIISIALAAIVVGAIVLGGGGDSQDNEKSIEEEIETAITGRAKAYCAISFANVKSTLVICTTIENTGVDTYTVYGYVVVTDNYGDKYKGNFDATVTVSSYSVVIDSFDLDTPRKQ